MRSMRRLGQAIWARPAGVILTAAITCMLAFPRVAAGWVGFVILAGTAGIWIARGWRRLEIDHRISARLAGWLAIAVVVAVAAFVFVPIFARSLLWVRGDWGPQHAVLRGVVDHLHRFELPHWNHRISTGDAPLDVYPAFTYVIAGAIAIVTGLEDRLPVVLVGLAVVAHTLIAVGGTRLALRFLSAPIAAVVGVLLVIDLGSISSGGVVGTIQTGLVHSAVSQAFSLFAVVAVVDAVRRPKLATSVAIWVWTALSTAAHPAGLLAVVVTVIALVGVALLARDVPARRPVAAICHLAIGTALSAFVWLPLGERIVLYGQHFSDVLAEPGQWLTNLLSNPVPQGSFAIVVYAGYAGMLAALWSRRATPIFVATTMLAMLVALVDTPYLAFDIAPSQFTARLGAMRFYGLVRPFAFVGAGYLAALAITHVRARWRDADRRSVLVAAFVAGVLGGAGVRFGCQSAELMIAQARSCASDHRNSEPLAAWAREQMTTVGPDRWARAAFLDTTAYYAHVTGITGLPAFHWGPIPDVLLRERFDDFDPDSLRRFNVRWVVNDDINRPLPLGDPSTERIIGNFKVREIAGWDGQFARVERGSGRAVVTRLDDDAVDVELLDTTQPALVVLGTGYYPRWRATAADGTAVPVYAYAATPTGHHHVVAAWLRPGTTRFSPDGPLPSDGDGRGLSLLALAMGLAIFCTWRRPRPRTWVLRRLARMRARWRPGVAAPIAAVVGSVALVASGVTASLAPVRALEVGGGTRATADVEIELGDGSWETCDYAHLLGEYHCDDLAIVRDTTAAIVNDEQVMWPYTTPSIEIVPPQRNRVQVRIVLRRRLAGRYWVGSRDQPVTVAISGAQPFDTDAQRVIDLDDGERTVTITTPVLARPLWVTFVREDTLQTGRMVPLAPDHP